MLQISVKQTFLNELLKVPRNIGGRVNTKIKELQANPHPIGNHSGQLKSNPDVYYTSVTRDYRLFYCFGSDWIQIISIGDRRDCYKKFYEPDLLILFSESINPNTLSIDRNKFTDPTPVVTSSTTNPKPLFTEIELRTWLIPKEYDAQLLTVNNELDLLELDIPWKYLSRIIDNLNPPSIEDIVDQPDLILEDPDNLNLFTNGQLDISHFLLKLDERQKYLVNLQTDSAILVKGGPGTGKSIVALYRVKALVEKKTEKILYTTHSESLISYSQQLLEGLLTCRPQNFRVDICTVDCLAINFYKAKCGEPEFPSDNGLILLQEARLNLSSEDYKILHRLTDEYLLEEITIVIEARGNKSIKDYAEESRFGRKLSLNKKQRYAIWSLYECWQKILRYSGYISRGQMRQVALEIVSQATNKIYQAVIIDEAQDLSPVALRFLAELVSDPSGLYLTADTSQSLYQKGFSWNYIQGYLGYKGETKILNQSYRSTRQISSACAAIIKDTQAGDRQTLFFTPSNLNGVSPILFLSDNHEQRIKRIQNFLRDSAKAHKLPLHSGVILVPSIDYGQMIARQLTTHGLRSKFIDSDEMSFHLPTLKVLTLHASKGLEFPFVIIVGLQQGLLPDLSYVPNDEVEEALKQQLRLLYVGCSRAMRSLLICGSKRSPSQFLKTLRNSPDWQIEEF